MLMPIPEQPTADDWFDALGTYGWIVRNSASLCLAIFADGLQSHGRLPSTQKIHHATLAEIASAVVRNAASIEVQLRGGHADSAMGTARAILELQVNFEIIAMDPTGTRAAQYSAFDEINFLEKLNRSGDTPSARLAELKADWPDVNTRDVNQWTRTTSEPRSLSMQQRIDRLVKSGLVDPEIEFEWIFLNKWAHSSPSSTRRLLARGTEKAHIVGGWFQGLDVPMRCANIRTLQVMRSFVRETNPLTGKSYERELSIIERCWQNNERWLRRMPDELMSPMKVVYR